ncbi:hypothetical protein QQ045_003618 [Rhodiola kirilowii]
MVSYFEGIFNGPFERVLIDLNLFDSVPKVREEDCSNLVRDVSWNEVTEIIRKLPSCKAAGPDGLNAEFYKASWEVVGPDLVNCIRVFLKTGVMPTGINSTYLALIPKQIKASVKLFDKQAQSAFVEGRNISYNVSLVQESLCNYKRKHVSNRCMIKLDISKAYDMVDWDFLCQVMELFGFPAQFIKWIRACIGTAKFFVLINGGMEGFFGSTRGLRQGDPISLYLFMLVMEVLSRVLGRMRGSAGFRYHPKCSRIGLTHLMFADDVIIFSKANLESLVKIKEALRLIYCWSGLKVSDDKSAIFFGGCTNAEEIRLARAVSFQKDHLPFLYLGVSLDGSSLKGGVYNSIIDKMTGKIKSWSAKLLSYAGRLVIVKHVLNAICSYWMRVLLFPKSVLKKISHLQKLPLVGE